MAISYSFTTLIILKIAFEKGVHILFVWFGAIECAAYIILNSGFNKYQLIGNVLNIDIVQEIKSDLQMSVFNVQGEKLASQYIDRNHPSSSKIKLNLSSLENGVYLLNVNGNLWNQTLKFIISR